MSAGGSLRAVLIDLSGTLHIENSAIPGAVDALKRLRNAPVSVRFVTNTTKESRQSLFQKLVGLGFEIQKDEIFTSLTAAADLVRQKSLKPYLVLEDEAMSDFKDGIISCQETPQDASAVVIGLAPSKFNYDTMNICFNLILNNKAHLIAIHKSRYFKTKSGLALGPGPFVTALEYATDATSTVVGKPSAQFFMQAIQPFNCKADEAVMIGDDARDDVGGAQNCGMRGILVQTGKYRSGDENKIQGGPDFLAPSFVEAVDIILTKIL